MKISVMAAAASEATKSWNNLLVPTVKHFGLNPTHLTTIHKQARKYVDKIIKFLH